MVYTVMGGGAILQQSSAFLTASKWERVGEQATFLQTGSNAGSLNPGSSPLTQFRPNRMALAAVLLIKNSIEGWASWERNLPIVLR